MNIQYVAQYSLVPGHFAGRAYSFDVLANKSDRKVKRRSNVSLSLDRRNTQTILHGIDEIYDLQTIPMLQTSQAVAQMREFLDSAFNGQYFQIDILGTAASPNSPFIAVLESDDYSESRQQMQYLTFSFTVRKATGRAINVGGVVGGPIT